MNGKKNTCRDLGVKALSFFVDASIVLMFAVLPGIVVMTIGDAVDFTKKGGK